MSKNRLGGPPSGREVLVINAGFIFAGTVRHLRAATIAGLPDERAAVVQVNSPLQSSALLEAYVGRDVTVELRDQDDLTEGDEIVFFADGWVYGQSIAVRELGHRSVPDDLARIRREIVEAKERIVEEDLRKRLANAVAVVVGRVAHTTEVVSRDERGPEREHDPRWFEAVIIVDSLLRGSLAHRTVTVLFPGSRDVKWRSAPKLHAGQSGIWVLHEQTVDELEQEVLVLLDSRDSYAIEQLPRIQALLGETR